MKYAVMANLSFSTPALRDNLDQAIKARILGKPTWGTIGMVKGTDLEGRPSHGLEIRFNNKADKDNLYPFIKSLMDTLPVVKGKVSWHECSHDESPPRPCQIAESYER